MKDIVCNAIMGFVVGLGVIITIHNINEYNASFDRCEELIVEVNQNLEILGNEIQILSEQMGVDYE